MLSLDVRRGHLVLALLVATFAVVTFGLRVDSAGASPSCVPASDLLSASLTEASCFEGFDGNQVSDHPGLVLPHTDWQNLVGGAGLITVRDDTGDSTFSGGDKESDPGAWAFDPNGSAQGKVDVLAVATKTDTVAGDTFVYGAFERLTSTGDVFLSFELNQLAAGFDHDNNAATGPIPERSEGDALITFSGNQGDINVYMCRWHGDGLGETSNATYGWYELPGFGQPDPTPGGGLTDKASGSEGCTLLDTTTSPAAAGEMNSGVLNNYLPRFGGPTPLPANGSGAPNTIADEEFGEMVINLDDAVQQGGAANPCFAFGSVWIHTRASHSFTNSMEDLTAPSTVANGSNCAIAVAKTVAVNQSSTPPADNTFTDTAPALTGETLHYKLDVTNAGQETITNVVVTDPVCSSAPVLDTAATTGEEDGELEVGETWIYRCSKTYLAGDNTIVNTGTAKGQVGTGTCPAAAGSITLKCLTATDTATVTRGVPPCVPPDVTGDPQNVTMTYGDGNAVFTASATGSPTPTVQWQVSTNGSGGPWTNIPGETTTTLTIVDPTVADSGKRFRAVFTNTCGTDNSTDALLTVNPKSVTGTCTVANKVYDGTTAATITGSALGAGVVAGDDVTLNATNASSVFPDPDVGNNKAVPCSNFTLSGADAGNYTLTMSNTTANITPKLITGNCTVANKVYDGTTAATVTGSSLGAGVVAGDDVSLDATNASSVFPDPNVGSNKAVPCSNFTLTGPDAGNYTLSMNNTTANITPKQLTGNCVVADKVYDGTNAATITGSSLGAGVVAGDDVSLDSSGQNSAFGNPDVGNDKPVPCSGYALSGADKDNYTLSMNNTTADITPKQITGNCTVANKVYDGTNAATITGSSLGAGVVAGDDVNLNGGGASSTFNNENVGNGKPATCAGFALSGADAGNYTLTMNNTTGNITPKVLVGTCTVANKVYDGTTAATITGSSLSGAVAGDAVSLNGSGANSAFGDPDVGNGKPTPCSGYTLAGADAGNYTLTMNPTTANITPKPVVASCTAADKDFDGNTDATLTGSSLTGKVGSDDVGLGGGRAEFDTPDPGRGKPVDCSGFTLTGADKGNYVLVNTLDTTATIRRPPPPAPLPPEVEECLRRPVFAFIKGGQQTQRVEFFLDGKKYGDVRKPDSRRRFGVDVDRGKLGPGTHVLSATIYFTKASGRRPLKLIVVKLKPCLGTGVSKGIAVTDIGSGNCVSKAFLAFVRGHTISTVVFSLNGKRVRRLSVADGSGRYRVRIRPSMLRAGKNVLAARITFIRGSKKSPVTLKKTMRPCG
jgi:uncharacterized repeat protein (TIGR01451 family)